VWKHSDKQKPRRARKR